MQLPQNLFTPRAVTSITLVAFPFTRYRPSSLPLQCSDIMVVEGEESFGSDWCTNQFQFRAPLSNRHPVVEAESMTILAPAIRLEHTLNDT
jgi:hypothetical protein